MAGTLTISTLSDGTNSTSSTNCIQGSAKAWVNFQGGASPSIRTSYNVSSVTRVSTGVYTVTFTNALTDLNYSYVGSYSSATYGALGINANSNNGSTVAPTSSAFTFTTMGVNASGTLTDPTYCNVVAFR